MRIYFEMHTLYESAYAHIHPLKCNGLAEVVLACNSAHATAQQKQAHALQKPATLHRSLIAIDREVHVWSCALCISIVYCYLCLSIVCRLAYRQCSRHVLAGS
jgi:hypothetical protein